jgi:NADPH-dependent glutamate synthase beta subunit-like oxidoreductase
LRKEVDEPVDILGLKRFAADSVAERKPLPLPKTKKEKVAIVGSGPAGLAAAYDLVREGYGVTIFEAFSTAGGMLALGIPEYRLPKDILEKEIEYIEGLGVEIKTGAALGKDFSLSELFDRGYGAIFIAIGAHRGMKLPVPGAELGNIMVGISLLKSLNLGKAVTMGDTVVVIGGGNVAVDCARSARRLGAKKVYMVCVESRENMPALASEVEQAEMEGVIILPSRTVTKIFGNHGKVKGLECLRLRRVEFDREGNLNFDAVEGSEHEISADTIIIAVGQTPEIDSVLEKDKIVCTKKGTIMVNPETMETNQPGVFAGGDAVSGPGTFIEAIAAGQKAAFFMDLYLKGRVLRRAYSLRATKREDIGTEIPVDIQRIERVRMPELSFAERALNFKEVALGFTADTAAKEAERCLNCAGALCRDVCPYGIPQFGYEENSKMQKCDLCVDRLDLGKEPICVAACPMRALDVGPLEELVKKYWDEKVIRGFINSPVIAPSIIFKPRER